MTADAIVFVNFIVAYTVLSYSWRETMFPNVSALKMLTLYIYIYEDSLGFFCFWVFFSDWKIKINATIYHFVKEVI